MAVVSIQREHNLTATYLQTVAGQLADKPNRGLVNSRTGQVADTVVISRTEQLAN